MTEDAIQSVLSAKELGAIQYQEFVADRIINSKVRLIYHPWQCIAGMVVYKIGFYELYKNGFR